MKDAATKSYLKKGQDVVDMNHKAIDAGATAFTQDRRARRLGRRRGRRPSEHAGGHVRHS